MPYNFKKYHFIVPEGYSSAEQAINSLSSKHTTQLEKLIGDEEKWLELMIEPQYSEKSWEEYSDLEDSILKMKIRVKDMETEVSRVTDSKWAEVLKSMIRELRESNTNLQSKLDYSESVFGKVPIKLI
jgi:hypothetical protein